MALTDKEISSEKQELDILFRSRRNEIVDLEGLIKNATARKYEIDEKLRDSQEGFKNTQDKLKEAHVNLQKVKVEAKTILSEANHVAGNAKGRLEEADALVEEKNKDLALLDRDKSIVVKAKKQSVENFEKSKELDKELKIVASKQFDLDELINKKKGLDDLKKSLDASKAELQEVIDTNRKVEESLHIEIDETKKVRGELESEIKRFSVSTKANEAATKLLEIKIGDKNEILKEIEGKKIGNSEQYAKVTASLAAKTRIVDAKEKKLDFILNKLKKEKKLEDDLKTIGL